MKLPFEYGSWTAEQTATQLGIGAVEVAVWWTSGAQNTQILQSGEIDMSDTWSARAFAAIESGAPVNIVWKGLYSIDGWSIASSIRGRSS